eukprot:gene1915-64_t
MTRTGSVLAVKKTEAPAAPEVHSTEIARLTNSAGLLPAARGAGAQKKKKHGNHALRPPGTGQETPPSGGTGTFVFTEGPELVTSARKRLRSADSSSRLGTHEVSPVTGRNSSSAASVHGYYKEGSLVVIQNIKKYADLNGRPARVVCFRPDEVRYDISISGFRKPLRVSAANLVSAPV